MCSGLLSILRPIQLCLISHSTNEVISLTGARLLVCREAVKELKRNPSLLCLACCSLLCSLLSVQEAKRIPNKVLGQGGWNV